MTPPGLFLPKTVSEAGVIVPEKIKLNIKGRLGNGIASF
jgi:hypothetical protein